MKTVKEISQHFVQFQFLMTHNNYFTQNLPILDNCNIFKQFTIFWNFIYTFFGKKQELTSPLYYFYLFSKRKVNFQVKTWMDENETNTLLQKMKG